MTEITNLNVNGKQLDLTKAFPLVLGDYRKLMLKGIYFDQLEGDTLKQLEFMAHIIQKANPDITQDDIDLLKPDEFQAISQSIQELSAQGVESSHPLENG